MSTAAGYLRAVRLMRDQVPSFDEYPFSIPAILNLEGGSKSFNFGLSQTVRCNEHDLQQVLEIHQSVGLSLMYWLNASSPR